jgi:hypothetical protein
MKVTYFFPIICSTISIKLSSHLQVVKHRPITSQGLSYTTFEAPKASRLQIPTVPRPTITTFSSANVVMNEVQTHNVSGDMH